MIASYNMNIAQADIQAGFHVLQIEKKVIPSFITNKVDANRKKKLSLQFTNKVDISNLNLNNTDSVTVIWILIPVMTTVFYCCKCYLFPSKISAH